MLITVLAVALGAVFVVSAVTKRASPVGWRAQAADMGVPKAAGDVVPPLEALLGALLISQLQRRWVAVAALGVLVAFTGLLVLRIAQGRRPPCACFGSWSSKPIGWSHVARNAVLIAIAVAIVVAG